MEAALARLNRQSELVNPPGDLLESLSLSNSVNTATAGVFDLTVQPFWTLYAKGARRNMPPTAAMIRVAHVRVSLGGGGAL